MDTVTIFEDYFIKLNKKFGITKLNYSEDSLDLDEKYIRNMVFAADDFNAEYEGLKNKCRKIYKTLKRGFLLKIRKDMSNNYFITII